MGNFTRQQAEKLIKETKKYKDIKKKWGPLHILMWLAYRFDLAEGEMLNLKIKDVFQKTNGKPKIKNLTIKRKTVRGKPTDIKVNFNADAKLKLETYYKYLKNKTKFKRTKRAPLFPGMNGKCYCSKTLYRHMHKLGKDFGASGVTLKGIRKSKIKKNTTSLLNQMKKSLPP